MTLNELRQQEKEIDRELDMLVKVKNNIQNQRNNFEEHTYFMLVNENLAEIVEKKNEKIE